MKLWEVQGRLQRCVRLLVAAKSRADGNKSSAADKKSGVGAFRSLLGDKEYYLAWYTNTSCLRALEKSKPVSDMFIF